MQKFGASMKSLVTTVESNLHYVLRKSAEVECVCCKVQSNSPSGTLHTQFDTPAVMMPRQIRGDTSTVNHEEEHSSKNNDNELNTWQH